ncbi:hypothetical protein B1R32_10727 [Abditibacterium utsteinense]|uniref:Uncharacterized protein n=1 Tax=Abditibacterium utsteinense TaxID=1960156 RepID=A0A2S8ST76_9BACT|nr:hypothetical protein [Abditibacterium utsteinense]PQV64002.1 hypothetical protein B1R32_10727 [Abditibacterium utsteinense]
MNQRDTQKYSNRIFWTLILAGIVAVTVQSVSLYGPIGAPLGVGTGASLGAVVYYLGAICAGAARWIRQQLQRP